MMERVIGSTAPMPWAASVAGCSFGFSLISALMLGVETTVLPLRRGGKSGCAAG